MNDHHHNHHDHSHSQSRLGLAFFITATYMVVEAIGGYLFNSLALLADAGHMLSDAMALALSWVAMRIGARSPNVTHTYGFKRTEILAALVNGVALWAIVAFIVYEAVQRFQSPAPVQGGGMMLVAALGLALNLVMAALLFKAGRENLNVKGAFLHVVGDALGSLGALLAAGIILLTGVYWVDPVVSVFICLLILYSSSSLIRESIHILMEGAPLGVDVDEIERTIANQQWVCCVYDLHVWSITSNRHALSARVVLDEPHPDNNTILKNLHDLLRERFNIHHQTIQLESGHELRDAEEGLHCRIGARCVKEGPAGPTEHKAETAPSVERGTARR